MYTFPFWFLQICSLLKNFYAILGFFLLQSQDKHWSLSGKDIFFSEKQSRLIATIIVNTMAKFMIPHSVHRSLTQPEEKINNTYNSLYKSSFINHLRQLKIFINFS